MNHLKFATTKRLLLCCWFLLTPLCSSFSFGDTLSHAFSISKSKSSNLVVYDVALKDDCSFANKDPQIHWMIPERGRNGLSRRLELSATERAYYGLHVTSYSASQIEGDIPALRNQKKEIKLILKTKKRGSHCLVAVTSTSRDADRSNDFSNLTLDFNGGDFQTDSSGNLSRDPSAATRYFISLQ